MNTDPIRELIANVTKVGLPGERAQLDAAGLKRISDAVHARIGQNNLMDCVEMVLAVANVFKNKLNSPTGAQALVDIVNDVDVVDALKRINQEAVQERRQMVKGYAKLGGMEIRRNAPRFGQKRAAGAIRVQDIYRPSRIT